MQSTRLRPRRPVLDRADVAQRVQAGLHRVGRRIGLRFREQRRRSAGGSARQVFRSARASQAAAARARGRKRGVEPAAAAQARNCGARAAAPQRPGACSATTAGGTKPRGALMRAWLSTRACVGRASSQKPREARRAAPAQARGSAPCGNSRFRVRHACECHTPAARRTRPARAHLRAGGRGQHRGDCKQPHHGRRTGPNVAKVPTAGDDERAALRRSPQQAAAHEPHTRR